MLTITSPESNVRCKLIDPELERNIKISIETSGLKEKDKPDVCLTLKNNEDIVISLYIFPANTDDYDYTKEREQLIVSKIVKVSEWMVTDYAESDDFVKYDTEIAFASDNVIWYRTREDYPKIKDDDEEELHHDSTILLFGDWTHDQKFKHDRFAYIKVTVKEEDWSDERIKAFIENSKIEIL